jgi:hypothetical protein
MKANNGCDSRLVWEQGRARESWKERGEGVACSGVGCSPFIGARKSRGNGGRAVSVGVMALIAIDDGVGLRPEIQGGGR